MSQKPQGFALALLLTACTTSSPDPAEETSSDDGASAVTAQIDGRERLVARCEDLAQCYLDTCGDDPVDWDWCVAPGNSECETPEDRECHYPVVPDCEAATSVRSEALEEAERCLGGSCVPECDVGPGW